MGRAQRKAKLAKRRTKPIIVNLGNIGFPGEPAAAETIRLAKRVPGLRVIGIDRRRLPSMGAQPGKKNWRDKKMPHGYYGRRIKNWQQVQADFRRGLEQLRDNSVSHITSKLGLGHYTAAAKELKKAELYEVSPNIFLQRQKYYERLKPFVKKHTAEVLQIAYRKLKSGGRVKLVVGEPVLETVKAALAETPFNQEKIEIRKMPSKRYVGTIEMRQYEYPMYRVTIQK